MLMMIVIISLCFFTETRTNVDEYEGMEVDDDKEGGPGPQRCK